MPSSAAPQDLPSFPTRRSSDLSSRRSSRSPTAWEAPRRARSPRSSRRTRFASGGTAAAASRRSSPAALVQRRVGVALEPGVAVPRSEEHTSELQSQSNLVCRLLPPPRIYPLSLHDALPISRAADLRDRRRHGRRQGGRGRLGARGERASRVAGRRQRRAGGRLLPRSFSGGSAWPWNRASRFQDRKSTRLNSSHSQISYAVFCRPPGSTLFPYTTLFRSLEPPIFAIADGMGGAKAGEVASELAANALREWRDGGSGEQAVVSCRARSAAGRRGLGTGRRGS